MTPREEAAAGIREATGDLVADRRPCLYVPNGYHSGEDCGRAHHPDRWPSVAPPVDALLGLAAPRLARELADRQGRTLDWQSKHDERSRAYALADRLRHRVALQDHLWPVGPILDQGREGACVGFASAAAANVLELSATFVGDPAANHDAADALRLYGRAQELDDISGEDYVGTSVLAGMKAGVEAGWWEGYGWCFGTRDIAQALLQVGPVVLGLSFPLGAPDRDGRLHLSGEAGPHCLTAVGLRMALPGVFQATPPGPYFILQNSWGESYGDHGLVYVHHADLARLLAGTGEAAIPLAAGWEPTS